MLKRVAGYIRVSTQMQAEEGFSIEAQKQKVLEYCKTYNLEPCRFYIDEGISGKSIEGRQALQRLLDDSKKGYFQEVITWKISRVARNVDDLLFFINELNKEGIILRSISENISTESVNSTFLVQMMGAVAELERKVIVENTKLGIHHKLRQGWYKGAPLLGYDIIPKKLCEEKQMKTNLKVNEPEAEIVRLIFKLNAEGKGYKAIVNELNNRQLKSKSGKLFSIGVVKTILNHRLYMGEMEHNIDGKIEIVKGRHKPIITKELWVATRKENKIKGKELERVFVLNRLLKCPSCGSTMVSGSSVGKLGKKYYYYKCGTYFNSGSSCCKANSIPAERIEDEVYKQLHTLISRPEIIKSVQVKINTHDTDYKNKTKAFNELNIKKEVLEKRKRLLMKQFELDKLSKEMFIQGISDVKKQLVEMEQTERELKQYLDDNAKSTVSMEEIKEVFQNLIEALRTQEPKQLQKLLSYIINEVTVNDDRHLKAVEFKIKGQKFYLDKEEVEQYDKQVR